MSLQATDVRRSYEGAERPVVVLDGVSFSMEPGQALAITGPSGSGKSTLLHLLGGLDRPTSGEIRIEGKDPGGLADAALARFRNATIGFVFQDHHLLPQYSVLENVLLPTLAFAPADPAAGPRARALLQRVGLEHRLTHRPAELSGGERQRVAVARALINGPSLLLCDEPTGSLDRASAEAVAALLLELHAEARNMLVVVTHSLELAGRCERNIELREGRCFER